MEKLLDMTKEQLAALVLAQRNVVAGEGNVLEQKDAELNQRDCAIEQKDALLAELAEKNAKLQQEYAQLQAEYNLLIQRMFGRRSERYTENPDQLKLDFGDSAEIDDAVEGLKDAIIASEQESEETSPSRKRPKKRRNEQLPEHLPRDEQIIDLPDDQKEGLSFIGYDIVETLVFNRPELRVLQTKYAKYSDPKRPDQGVQSPPREEGLVEGNRYDTSVATEIIVGKYGYHMPIYREQDKFAGSGWTPGRSTLLNIQMAAADLVVPFVDYLADEVRCDDCLGTDDTGVTLLLPPTIPAVDAQSSRSQREHDVISAAIRKGGKSVKAKMWAYRGQHIPLNVFDFTVSRHRDGPDEFLIDTGYKGVLLGDCYTGYTGISRHSSELITHAACNAHARRKIFEAMSNHPVHVSNLLGMYQELYDIEDRGKWLDATGLLELRAGESTAVWSRIGAYLNSDGMENVLPKEQFGKAIGYLRGNWAALQVYVTNASVPIDNNETEQLMKQVAVGRKNWLFIGSIAAGRRAANLMTLVSSALRNDLDVWIYIKSLLDALLSGSTDYASLRPDIWAQSHPKHIRRYRVEERRDRADRKQRQRVARRATKVLRA
jgi:transposase